MTVTLPVYLDNHSTTRTDPRVVSEMLPYFETEYGNAASSQHRYGWKAGGAVARARRQAAQLINADENEIVFTSGATESINLALKGIAAGFGFKGHVVTCLTEHKATLESCTTLERAGMSVTRLPVDRDGVCSLARLERALRPDTILVSIMAANNEIGTIAPLGEIGALCRGKKILFHTDAAQAAGKIPVDVRAMQIDLLSFTSHKMYGPKGVGALFVRRRNSRIPLVPQAEGGGHEHGYRSGTLNVPGIVGFGKACEIAGEEMENERVRLPALRSMLVEGIRRDIPGLQVNGEGASRLPGNANLLLPGVMADQLMVEMNDVAVSAGSACSSSNPTPSHVLKSIGLTDDEARSSIRFGLGRFTTEEEIQYTIGRVHQIVMANSPIINQPAIS